MSEMISAGYMPCMNKGRRHFLIKCGPMAPITFDLAAAPDFEQEASDSAFNSNTESSDDEEPMPADRGHKRPTKFSDVRARVSKYISAIKGL